MKYVVVKAFGAYQRGQVLVDPTLPNTLLARNCVRVPDSTAANAASAPPRPSSTAASPPPPPPSTAAPSEK